MYYTEIFKVVYFKLDINAKHPITKTKICLAQPNKPKSTKAKDFTG